MKSLKIVALTFALAVVVRSDGVPTVVTYVPHDKVTSTMAKGGSIINDHGLIVLAQRRGAGEVEVHENTNHVFIVVEGEATFVSPSPCSYSRIEKIASHRIRFIPDERRILRKPCRMPVLPDGPSASAHPVPGVR